MSLVTLVRHGQANTEARDEANYDRLSPLGHKQARWLGTHLAGSGEVFARSFSGTLRRHRETAEGINLRGLPAPHQDARWNEIEYFTLSQLMEEQHGLAMPHEREEFVAHLPQVFAAWAGGRIEGAPESFATFEARVHDALHEASEGEGRVLVVTSGGVIGMALRLTLGLDIETMARLCLTIENSSLHRWLPLGGKLALTEFNALPHLETPERQLARTHV